MEFKSTVKLSVVLIAIIILLSTISVGGLHIINQTCHEVNQETISLKNELKYTWSNLNTSIEELSNLNSEYEIYETMLEENETELQLLRSGDEYTLHDPTYSEVVDFIENDISEDDKELLEKTKGNGIRSALVLVLLFEGMSNVLKNSYLYISIHYKVQTSIYDKIHFF